MITPLTAGVSGIKAAGRNTKKQNDKHVFPYHSAFLLPSYVPDLSLLDIIALIFRFITSKKLSERSIRSEGIY